ncbi:FAD:protein FMN transferase [Alicyclobacillus sacchari]|nr:FAD:protein FMN transferase [Alicyclobacillus sacchari]
MERPASVQKAFVAMDTRVAITGVSRHHAEADIGLRIESAIRPFYEVEASCSRFRSDSEVRRLLHHVGEAVVVSPLLYHPLRFALTIADITAGQFDPAVGRRMERLGFAIDYQSGCSIASVSVPDDVTYRDITLDDEHRTVTLHRPVVIDLGAVAKGFAVDLAATQLQELDGFVIDAGGDIYAGGLRPDGKPWRIGIRHPRVSGATVATLAISNCAVCTSGDYERKSRVEPGASHIVLPQRGGTSPASVTVIARYAMMADALSTAAMVLGPDEGRALLAKCGVEGLFIMPDLSTFTTDQWEVYTDE